VFIDGVTCFSVYSICCITSRTGY